MSMFDVEDVPIRSERTPHPMSDIDTALTSQLVVAWAGETGEERRLGWWRSDLVSEYGGEDLFRRLLPGTWRWAVLQGAREAACRKDAELRRQDHDPDRVVSLFSLGFELDERIDERFQDLKRSGRAPDEALPGLTIVSDGWCRDQFWDWVMGHGEADAAASPIGRRLKGSPPIALDLRVRKLVAGLAPAADTYPLPHYMRAS
ncbi:BREX-6 system BrxE protein [Micromonospora phytophila]|uniref:BREX-6 system BrxE protein n=1 Tax=Micromonospora phytophila TaxID=709888 RepID=UPI00202E18BA|nr:BREX-6 system BrxE protein [Micromonospora phytophila]MCM0673232.1 BREX-6 system BrxE protein [Micromonospora phytophila]